MVLLLRGHGHTPYVVAGSDPAQLHADFSAALTQALDEIADIQGEARASAGPVQRRRWPMIVLRSPKGWTGPKGGDGQRVEGSWRSHQVPFASARRRRAPEVPAEWMRGYEPESLFDEAGAPAPDVAALHPGPLRMSASPHVNGGLLLRDLRMPDFRDYAVEVERPAGTGSAETTRMLGGFLRDVMAGNSQRFRMFAPDENSSNWLQDVMEVTDRTWNAEIRDYEDHLAPDGRIVEILSEHTCQGWLEGYLLTAGTGCPPATRRSSTSSTRCSTSTRSG